MTVPTVADFRTQGIHLKAYCKECGREKDIDLTKVSLPGTMPIAEVWTKLKCRDCGSKKIFTSPVEPAGVE
jgi:hypothetical protein